MTKNNSAKIIKGYSYERIAQRICWQEDIAEAFKAHSLPMLRCALFKHLKTELRVLLDIDPIPHQSAMKEQRKQKALLLRELYPDITIKQIADRIGVSAQSVRNYLK